MGTRYSAIFYGEPSADPGQVKAELQTAVDAVDMQMSPWKPDSSLERLNATPVGQWLDIPPEFAAVLAVSREMAEISDGAFNAATGKLVNAWGFGPDRNAPDESLATQLEQTPVSKLPFEVEPLVGRARRLDDVRIDLCGIAKGFGVDQLADALERRGIGNYLVSIDGELRSGGQKPDGESWVVGVEAPDPAARTASTLLALEDLAIATSGTYRHFAEVSGKRVSHTMNPFSRRPVDNALRSVSVIADTCVFADAWATALMVMGETNGREFAQSHGISALFTFECAGGNQTKGTGLFETF